MLEEIEYDTEKAVKLIRDIRKITMGVPRFGTYFTADQARRADEALAEIYEKTTAFLLEY